MCKSLPVVLHILTIYYKSTSQLKILQSVPLRFKSLNIVFLLLSETHALNNIHT